jgi:hypothetical protein
MKATINHRTRYSQSPVLIISESNGQGFSLPVIKLALTATGEIYRLLDYKEQPQECPPFEVELSEKTADLIENWRKCRTYTTPCHLMQLAAIQRYYLELGYGTISSHPLHELKIGEYYIASAALEQKQRAEIFLRDLSTKNAEISSLKNQLRIVQAKLKVPAKMAEKSCNEKQALAYILGGRLHESNLTDLFKNKVIRPNGYTGSGKHISKGTNKAAQISAILTDAGIKHTTGNDAQKGGFSGNFIKIK